jgi:hypothetical protein
MRDELRRNPRSCRAASHSCRQAQTVEKSPRFAAPTGRAREPRTWPRTDARKYWPTELWTKPQESTAWEKNGPSENQIAGEPISEVQRSSPKQRPRLGLLGGARLRRIATCWAAGGGSGTGIQHSPFAALDRGGTRPLKSMHNWIFTRPIFASAKGSSIPIAGIELYAGSRLTRSKCRGSPPTS